MNSRGIRATPSLCLAALFILICDALVTAQTPAFDPMERGRALTQAFYAGEITNVVEAFDAGMREAMGGVEGALAFHEQVRMDLGEETDVVNETVRQEGEHIVYLRTAQFARAEQPFIVLWAFHATGRVAGFSIRGDLNSPSEAPSQYLDYATRTKLRLPFEGEWLVIWGGPTVEENYHAAHVDQRFAYDVAVEVEGARHRGEGTRNEEYHCWGRPILAPGSGIVAAARDGLPDNAPGRMDPTVPPGNHVVIDHGNGEYSFLAHVQQGSVTARQGDPVSQGDLLGKCGNSGNSSEPHLHYHLQDSPRFGEGEGMPAPFLGYVADGLPVERGEPVQGQRIRPGGSDGG